MRGLLEWFGIKEVDQLEEAACQHQDALDRVVLGEEHDHKDKEESANQEDEGERSTVNSVGFKVFYQHSYQTLAVALR